MNRFPTWRGRAARTVPRPRGDEPATIGVAVELPIAILADTVTLGGVITDRDEPYTSTAAKRISENISNMTDPDE